MRTKPRLSGRSWQIDAVKPETRIGAEEGAGIAGAHRERAPAVKRVAHADAEFAHQACDIVVERDRPRAAIDQPRLQMVLQILAHAAQLVHHPNAEALQRRPRRVVVWK